MIKNKFEDRQICHKNSATYKCNKNLVSCHFNSLFMIFVSAVDVRYCQLKYLNVT